MSSSPRPCNGQVRPSIIGMIDQQPKDELEDFNVEDSTHRWNSLTYQDIVYVVKSCCNIKAKTILHSVNGILPEGVNAIMGPTGSGKTSLLDILAGRKNPSQVNGSVLIGGVKQPKNFKCIAGYVVQDDVVMGTLTVRENLHFSAALRLPSKYTRAQRKERVEKVILELGLQDCANTKIGTEFIRGVSGGERKRTNIGMELIIEPKVLFLDEPTTGLDAHTAVSVVKKLKSLSKQRNCIIVMSIHQPRYSIFKQFDTLTLLSRGNTVYHGPAQQALTYFDKLGFPCEEHENPADFFLDVVIQCQATETADGDAEDRPTNQVDLVEAYKISEEFHGTVSELSLIKGKPGVKHNDKGSHKFFDTDSYATSVFWQLLVVSFRSMKNLLRNPMTSVFQIVTMIIFGLLVGILYLQLNNKDFNIQSIISNRVGVFFFIVMNQVFGNLSAIEVFIKQRALFIHENISGFYRVSVFFGSKVITDMIPMRLFPLLFYAVIVYFMVGLQLEAANFFIFLLTLALVSVTASSVAFAISAKVGVISIANLLIAMFFVFSMLFGGFFVSLESLPVWLQWLKYVSFFRYAIEALLINEVAGQCYFDPSNFTGGSSISFPCSEYINITGNPSCDLPTCVNGSLALSNLGYESSFAWLWYDQVGLLCLIIIFLFLTYFNLRTIKKLK